MPTRRVAAAMMTHLEHRDLLARPGLACAPRPPIPGRP
jgi:hypothetical protein